MVTVHQGRMARRTPSRAHSPSPREKKDMRGDECLLCCPCASLLDIPCEFSRLRFEWHRPATVSTGELRRTWSWTTTPNRPPWPSPPGRPTRHRRCCARWPTHRCSSRRHDARRGTSTTSSDARRYVRRERLQLDGGFHRFDFQSAVNFVGVSRVHVRCCVDGLNCQCAVTGE